MSQCTSPPTVYIRYTISIMYIYIKKFSNIRFWHTLTYDSPALC
jgi:hypothetical protein